MTGRVLKAEMLNAKAKAALFVFGKIIVNENEIEEEEGCAFLDWINYD